MPRAAEAAFIFGDERGLRAGVPAGQQARDVVRRGDEHQLQQGCARSGAGRRGPGRSSRRGRRTRPPPGGRPRSSGPGSASASGWSLRITYAVITLATLAIGTGLWSPHVPRLPMSSRPQRRLAVARPRQGPGEAVVGRGDLAEVGLRGGPEAVGGQDRRDDAAAQDQSHPGGPKAGAPAKAAAGLLGFRGLWPRTSASVPFLAPPRRNPSSPARRAGDSGRSDAACSSTSGLGTIEASGGPASHAISNSTL